MKSSLTIFLLFFGVATLDALRGGNALSIAFWLAMGLLFLAVEWFGERRASRRGAKARAGSA